MLYWTEHLNHDQLVEWIYYYLKFIVFHASLRNINKQNTQSLEGAGIFRWDCSDAISIIVETYWSRSNLGLSKLFSKEKAWTLVRKVKK